MKRVLGLCVLMIWVSTGIATATVPATMSYQGRLQDPGGQVLPDGTYNLTFRLYGQSSGGAPLWSEVQSLPVRDGVFSAVLGSVTPLNLPFDAQYWISLQVGGDPELPRVVLTSTPYALRAAVAEALVGGGGSGDITAVYADNGLTGGAPTGDAHVGVGAGAGISVTADAVAVDGAAVAGAGLVAEGASAVAVNPGTGLTVAGDQVRLTDPYATGTAYDARFVNESQAGSVTADMVVPNVVSSVDGVVNDGGNIDLVAGANVTITPDDANNTITIASTGGGGGIGGGGTQNYLSKFTGPTTIGDALLWDNGTRADLHTYGFDAGWPVLGARYVGPPYAYDLVAVQGTAVPADYYGIGGVFKGGYMGIQAVVEPTGDLTYFGLQSNVNGGAGSSTNFGIQTSASGSGWTNIGIQSTAWGGTSYAGYFEGNVHVGGHLTVSGTKAFRIDHPMDPANKYLNHFCVESDEVLNTYGGNAVLDAAGEAWVELAGWFGAINRDPRYQLTCIGGQAPVYVAEEISGNRFKIAGGNPGLKVSWQVMAVRSDPAIEKYRLPVEQEKPAPERGKYLQPELYGAPDALRIGRIEAKAQK